MPSIPPLTPATGGRLINEQTLKTGDIVVLTTDGLVSDIINTVTDGPVSHVMVSVGNNQIVEAVRDGIRKISLNAALDDATLAVAFRRKSITNSQIDTIVNNVQSAVGESYNYWGIIKRLLTEHVSSTYEVPLPTDSFYCSQLVLTAFASAGVPLLGRGDVSAWPTNIVSFDDFGESLIEYVGHLRA